MFQNAWFDRKDYSSLETTSVSPPSTFIRNDEIEMVTTLYWDEHCLECSAPACYATCKKYKARKDKLCKRLVYGIKHEKPIDGFLWNVRVQFREWGKLEARINKGTLSPEEIQSLDRKDFYKTAAFHVASGVLTHSDCGISTKWDGLKRKKYASMESRTPFANDFLLQVFSYEHVQYKLNFEITDQNNVVVFKTSINISPGYNQELIKLEFIPPEGGLIRLYPENNLEAELTIYAADLVKLKKAIPEKPAKKVKCVAWDLDNTIWEGILAESRPDELQIRKSVVRTIGELDRRGILQIVVSKNDYETVLPVLKRLGVENYFVYILSNWNSKSVNIYNAARMLNINVDTFALVDDSEFERSEVSETLPCVRTYDEHVETLLERKEFDVEISSESEKRRESYQLEASRKKVLSNSFSGDNTAFIKSCKIEIVLKRIQNEEEAKRSYELLQRTNQLNLSARKYTEAEFEKILRGEGESLIAFVKDRFGDYGQIAFIHFSAGDRLVITEFAMSCRVAGKYVEAAIFHTLLRQYQKEILMLGQKTDRNRTLVDALNKCGFSDCSESDDEIRMTLSERVKVPFSAINQIKWGMD